MILPFVREIFAELEQSSSFDRVRRHLSLGVAGTHTPGIIDEKMPPDVSITLALVVMGPGLRRDDERKMV